MSVFQQTNISKICSDRINILREKLSKKKIVYKCCNRLSIYDLERYLFLVLSRMTRLDLL